jgi:hypothetical protein
MSTGKPTSLRIEGYAIVTADGMLADRDGRMPPGLKIDADQRFFEQGLEAVNLIVHGKHSHEQQANSGRRRRLVLTRKIAALAQHPSLPKAHLWNPAGASFADACSAVGIAEAVVAVIGGTDAFGLFLTIGYDAFHLSRVRSIRLPNGRAVFPGVPARAPEDILSRYGLVPGPARMLDARAEAMLVTWRPRNTH